MNQGCPGEGKDNRTLGWLICPLQRLCSWKSDKLPVLHVSLDRMRAWSYWPPYYVSNKPVIGSADARGQWFFALWRMFRIGWRYDKQWKGYIGPAAAYKKVPNPLLYY